MNASEYLKNGCSKAGINIEEQTVSKLIKYMNDVLEINKSLNLTANTEMEEFIELNIIDSLSICKFIPLQSDLIDIGTGCGLPGLVLKIVRPDLNITLLDSTEKKMTFVEDEAEKLSLNGVKTICGRAEELSRQEIYREKFAVAVSRAVAPLGRLCELCLPYVKNKGIFIAMKGKNYKEEMNGSQVVFENLGVTSITHNEFFLPYTNAERALLIFEKGTSCKLEFPRKYAKISKKPLF